MSIVNKQRTQRGSGEKSRPEPGRVHGMLTGQEAKVQSGGGPASAAIPDFTYHGGPVLTCPQVYTSFWGAHWLSDPTHLERAGRLAQFYQDLLASEFMNVLSQYGAGFGAGSGLFMRASFVTGAPTTLTNALIESTVQSCINAGVLPEPSRSSASQPYNQVIIIFLDETISLNDPAFFNISLCEQPNAADFGYHYYFTTSTGNQCYYAVVAALDDGCLKGTCASDNFCSLHLAQTQEERLTQVATHEFAEMVTDPELTGWNSPSADENGDICNGISDTITVGSNTWNVQKVYSKSDDTSSSDTTANFCVAKAASPKPKLSGGPSAAMLTEAIRQRLGIPSHQRVLPLPSIRFDMSTSKVALDEAEVHNYVKGVFHPLQREQIIADLPGFLHQVADIIR